MPATIVLGAQWGDEGKGKVVDALAETADMVVRYQGGATPAHHRRRRRAVRPVADPQWGHVRPLHTGDRLGMCGRSAVLLGEIDMLTERDRPPAGSGYPATPTW